MELNVKEPRGTAENAPTVAEALRTYDAQSAAIYDHLELRDGSIAAINGFVVRTLRESGRVERVLDMTCGTGAQVIALVAAGFKVTASDLSGEMLRLARAKFADAGYDIPTHQADMRDVSLGRFDAIISMYNAVGHLRPDEFRMACANAADHLGEGGIYIFDIFDRDAMGHVPTHEMLDTAMEVGQSRYARFSTMEFDRKSGVLHLRQKTFEQKEMSRLRLLQHDYTLQTYSREELIDTLSGSGFSDVRILRVPEAAPGFNALGQLMHIAIARR